MLRWLFALVLLLNVAWYAWAHAWLAPVGLAPVPPGEPERLQQQVRPERMRILKDTPANVPHPVPSVPAAPAPAAAPEPRAEAPAQDAAPVAAPVSAAARVPVVHRRLTTPMGMRPASAASGAVVRRRRPRVRPHASAAVPRPARPARPAPAPAAAQP